MEFIQAGPADVDAALEIIESGRRHLRDQGIDQWQDGYPDRAALERDAACGKGYLIRSGGETLGYLCVDFDGEPVYDGLIGRWGTGEPYVVVHRLAFSAAARGRGLSGAVFALVEEMSRRRGVFSFRIDTHEDNRKMQHILEKSGFARRGTVFYGTGRRVAFDKPIGGSR